MKSNLIVCCVLLPFVSLLGCGGSEEPAPPAQEAAFVCEPTAEVTEVTDLNYPQSDCETATSMAEEKLDGHHYRKACMDATPGAPLPHSVSTAHVTDCRATDDRGVFVDVELCCEESSIVEPEPTSVVRAEGPECPTWRTRTRASALHYPDAGSCAEIFTRAEGDTGIVHYRNACKDAAPRATRPVGVLEARVVECRAGGGVTGVVVDVELCCDVKVFDEREFRDLVWQRPPEEIRAVLGEPQQVTEWPQGPHWAYPIEVARDKRVFPGVTVVFVDGRVDSYSFQ